ncbi:MAG: PilZ domain-containing protein [Acidobacteria bacterium]|nr:PilZ domain-containing protein [Acidobacteriota bacterium]
MKEQRSAPRREFFSDVVLGTQHAHYVGQSENLSESGMLVKMKRDLPVGTELKMAFGHPPRLPMVQTAAVVRRQAPGERLGVAFRGISESDRGALRSYLEQLSI